MILHVLADVNGSDELRKTIIWVKKDRILHVLADVNGSDELRVTIINE